MGGRLSWILDADLAPASGSALFLLKHLTRSDDRRTAFGRLDACKAKGLREADGGPVARLPVEHDGVGEYLIPGCHTGGVEKVRPEAKAVFVSADMFPYAVLFTASASRSGACRDGGERAALIEVVNRLERCNGSTRGTNTRCNHQIPGAGHPSRPVTLGENHHGDCGDDERRKEAAK